METGVLNDVLKAVAEAFKPMFREVMAEELKSTSAGGALPPEVQVMEILRRKESLTPEEVSRLFSLNRNTLAAWRCSGRGPAYSKDGAVILYRRADVEAYLRSTKTRTIDQPAK